MTHSAEYLDAADQLGAVQRYKSEALRNLKVAQGDRVLEVGCGTGGDALELAAQVGPHGLVLGVDINAEIIAEARRRAAATGLPVRFEVVDGTRLASLADDSFDAARIDRVLHLAAEPLEVLEETARVVRPGGRIVVSEPDWTTLTLDCDEPALSARILAHARERVRSPGQGRCLGRLFAAAGLVERELHPWAGSVTRYEQARVLVPLEAMAQEAAAAGVIDPIEQLRWLASLIRADRLGFFHVSMMLFTVVGVVPATPGGTR